MYRYVIIDENGLIVGISYLSGKVNQNDMILVSEDFDITNKKYENGKWIEYIKEEKIPKLRQQEIINAQIISKLDYLECLSELNTMKGGL